MEYNEKNEFYYDYFISEGYKYVSNGYMHNIFEKDNRIIKIVKSVFMKFDSKENYLLEKKCLNILKDNGYMTPEIYKIGQLSLDGKKIYYLEEEKINGEIKMYSEMNEIEKNNFFRLVNDIAKIKGQKYGKISLKKDGEYDTWLDYLKVLFRKSRNVIKKYNLKIEFDEIEKDILSKIDNSIECSFLMLDPNEKNFFLKNNKVSCIIDIDHPIYGDKLYQLALFNYFRNDYYLYLIKKGFITAEKIKIIDLYTIVFALNDVYFRLSAEEKNRKNITSYLSKVMNTYNEFKGGRKK